MIPQYFDAKHFLANYYIKESDASFLTISHYSWLITILTQIPTCRLFCDLTTRIYLQFGFYGSVWMFWFFFVFFYSQRSEARSDSRENNETFPPPNTKLARGLKSAQGP